MQFTLYAANPLGPSQRTLLPHFMVPLSLLRPGVCIRERLKGARIMNRPLYCTLVAAALAAGPLLAGCERDVSKTETTKVKSDGTVEKRESKVTENSDGTVTRTARRPRSFM